MVFNIRNAYIQFGGFCGAVLQANSTNILQVYI